MSWMMDEIREQPRALRRTFKAERAHALQFKRFASKRGFRLIVAGNDHSTLREATLAQLRVLKNREPAA